MGSCMKFNALIFIRLHAFSLYCDALEFLLVSNNFQGVQKLIIASIFGVTIVENLEVKRAGTTAILILVTWPPVIYNNSTELANQS